MDFVAGCFGAIFRYCLSMIWIWDLATLVTCVFFLVSSESAASSTLSFCTVVLNTVWNQGVMRVGCSDGSNDHNSSASVQFLVMELHNLGMRIQSRVMLDIYVNVDQVAVCGIKLVADVTHIQDLDDITNIGRCTTTEAIRAPSVHFKVHIVALGKEQRYTITLVFTSGLPNKWEPIIFPSYFQCSL